MDQQQRGHKIIKLSFLIVFGIAYCSLLYSQCAPIGMNNLAGIIGVLLGLYICSQPAANLMDMLFYRRVFRHQFSTKQSVVLWLALNVLVLLIGGIVMFIGTTRFLGKAD